MNYKNMTNLEINQAVANLQGGYAGKCEDKHRPDLVCVYDSDYGNAFHTERDYCSNPSDSHPIMVANGIWSGPWNSELWQSFVNQGGDNYQLRTIDKSPLRAAMIVYLKMNEPSDNGGNYMAEDTEKLKEEAQKALREAESAWHKYAASCELSDERIKAFEVFENVRNAQRVY